MAKLIPFPQQPEKTQEEQLQSLENKYFVLFNAALETLQKILQIDPEIAEYIAEQSGFL